MLRSKLEKHIDILEAATRHGPLNLTQITHKADISHSRLIRYLEFSIQHNLIEEQTLHKKRHSKQSKVVYAITERGRIVLNYFKKLNKALHVAETSMKPELGATLSKKGARNCLHHLGFLKTYPLDKPIPSECLDCTKVVSCFEDEHQDYIIWQDSRFR